MAHKTCGRSRFPIGPSTSPRPIAGPHICHHPGQFLLLPPPSVWNHSIPSEAKIPRRSDPSKPLKPSSDLYPGATPGRPQRPSRPARLSGGVLQVPEVNHRFYLWRRRSLVKPPGETVIDGLVFTLLSQNTTE